MSRFFLHQRLAACDFTCTADDWGIRCVVVELRETEIDALTKKGLLKTDARNDPYAIRQALHAYLDHTFSETSPNSHAST